MDSQQDARAMRLERQPQRALMLGTVHALASIALLSNVAGTRAVAQGSDDLRAPSAFANIADADARSRALFSEAAKVITNPRCMNCHPASDSPLQGNDKHRHIPPVMRLGQDICTKASRRGAVTPIIRHNGEANVRRKS